jgi:hypothetical protein
MPQIASQQVSRHADRSPLAARIGVVLMIGLLAVGTGGPLASCGVRRRAVAELLLGLTYSQTS